MVEGDIGYEQAMYQETSATLCITHTFPQHYISHRTRPGTAC